MRKSLGSKRKELSDEHITEITRLIGQFIEVCNCKKPISPYPGFTKQRLRLSHISVECPLGDENGQIVLASKGKLKDQLQPGSSQRDTENVPMHEEVETCFNREVLLHAPDAWIDRDKTGIGYEIPFNRQFYVFESRRARWPRLTRI